MSIHVSDKSNFISQCQASWHVRGGLPEIETLRCSRSSGKRYQNLSNTHKNTSDDPRNPPTRPRHRLRLGRLHPIPSTIPPQILHHRNLPHPHNPLHPPPSLRSLRPLLLLPSRNPHPHPQLPHQLHPSQSPDHRFLFQEMSLPPFLSRTRKRTFRDPLRHCCPRTRVSEPNFRYPGRGGECLFRAKCGGCNGHPHPHR